MTKWRPSQSIRVKALGLHWRSGKILASEIYSDDGTIKGVRPLGGHVEFGETWQTALAREFQEELGVEVKLTSNLNILENIYEHHGAVGHEIVFLGEVVFPEGAFDGVREVKFYEDNGVACVAHWYGPDDLDAKGLSLYPEGLRDLIFSG